MLNKNRNKIPLLSLALFTSFLLMTLQPNVNPKVSATLQKVGLQQHWHDFLQLWQAFCVPYLVADVIILIAGLLLFAITGWLVLQSDISAIKKALLFGFSYSFLHCIWYFLYFDPFVPLHGAASSIMFAVVLYHMDDTETSFSDKPRELAVPYIQERIGTLRQTLNYSISIGFAISVSLLAFNYQFMEKNFQVLGKGNYEIALWHSQVSQVTMLSWNIILFVSMYIPVIYSRIRLLNRAILDLKIDKS